MRLIQAVAGDFEAMAAFYDDVIDRTPGIDRLAQWKKGFHPNERGLKAHLGEGNIYLYKDGKKILGAVALSMYQPEEYRAVEWTVDARDDEVAVLSLLAVSPDLQGSGTGTEMIMDTIRLASANGKKAVRLDALSTNTPVHRLYRRLGFKYCGQQRLLAENTYLVDFFFFEYPVK